MPFVLVPSLPLLAALCPPPLTKDISDQRYVQPKKPPTKEREDGNLPAAVFHADKNFYWHKCQWLKSHLLQINKYKKSPITQHLLAHKCGLQISFTSTHYAMQVQMV